MSFEDWCKENDHDIFSIGLEEAYKAGAASRQVEIDELKKELETLQGMHNAVSLTAGDLLDERDELQKRIANGVAAWGSLTSIAVTHLKELPDEFYQKLDELHEKLIGKNND